MIISFGTLCINSFNSSLSTTVPVGLFGLHMQIIFVLSVIALYIAFRSNFKSSVRGRTTGVPSFRITAPAYAPNVGSQNITSSPFLINTSPRSDKIPLAPTAITTLSPLSSNPFITPIFFLISIQNGSG